MTTSSDINTLRTSGAGAATAEQAQRAVKAFRALQPTLTAYARNLTGRQDVRVEMAAQDNGSTDGKRIFFRPPIALGADTKHQRSVCGRRDKGTLLNLCAACDAREDVLVTIYHEIAHIAFETFVDVDDDEAARVAADAAEAAGGEWAKHVAERIRKAPTYMKRNYMAVANLASPFMPLLWNALEDARVNAEMFSARPGTKVMFDSNTKKIFAEGVEQVDRATGEIIVKKWDEYPANMQILVGLFCKASGYDYRGWFAPQIERALADPELNQLLTRMPTIRSTRGIYNLCFPLLTRLRQLGFCKTDDEPEEEPEPQPEGESDDKSEDQPESDAGDDSSDDVDEADAGAAEPSGQPEGGDDAGDSEGEADGDDESEDAAGGGADREESGSEGDPDEDDSSGDTDPDAGPAAGQPDAGTDEEDEGTGDSDSADGASDGDAESASEGGAESDSAEEEVGSNAAGGEGVDDDSTPMDEAGDSDGGDSRDEELGDGGEQAPEESPAEDEAGITGTGDAGDDRAEGEGTGGQQEYETGSGGEDLEGDGSDADSSDQHNSDGSDPEVGGSPADGSGSDDDLAGDGDGADEPADAGSADPSEDEPFDTGADSGQGGTELIEDESLEDKPLEMGTAEDAKVGLLKFGDHEEKPKTMEEKAAEKAVDVAIVQGLYFETPSRNITGVREHRWGVPHIIEGFNFSQAWDESGFYSIMGRRSGRDSDTEIAESILGPALMRMRVAFADNQRGHNKQHLKSGKVNGRVLGKRAHLGDPRLFRKKVQPGKKNYLVVIGMDVSGSTAGVNIALEKQAVKAQAELCRRMGIPFAIYAHSGNYWSPTGGRSSGFALDVYVIKEEHESWDKGTQERLDKLGPDSANLDGHFLEYLRKRADESQATDTVILYYSDGKMPAENHDEELEILQREIKTCDKKGYTLLGVGIRTDSPARHGLDTVQVDSGEDVGKVVKHLEKRLMAASAR